MLLKHNKLNEHEQKLVDMSVKEFDDYMMSNYPNMFKNRCRQEGQEMILPMNFGFEIGPGWRHVLDSLCKGLKVIQDLTGYVCVFDQIKEKFGGARFYYHIEKKNDKGEEDVKGNYIEEIIRTLVSRYEEYCDYICEELGTNVNLGEKIVLGRWYYGMGIDGFKKEAKKRWGEDAELRIKSAENYLKRLEIEKDIQWEIKKCNIEELNKIKAFVNSIFEESEKSEIQGETK